MTDGWNFMSLPFRKKSVSFEASYSTKTVTSGGILGLKQQFKSETELWSQLTSLTLKEWNLQKEFEKIVFLSRWLQAHVSTNCKCTWWSNIWTNPRHAEPNAATWWLEKLSFCQGIMRPKLVCCIMRLKVTVSKNIQIKLRRKMSYKSCWPGQTTNSDQSARQNLQQLKATSQLSVTTSLLTRSHRLSIQNLKNTEKLQCINIWIFWAKELKH